MFMQHCLLTCSHAGIDISRVLVSLYIFQQHNLACAHQRSVCMSTYQERVRHPPCVPYKCISGACQLQRDVSEFISLRLAQSEMTLLALAPKPQLLITCEEVDPDAVTIWSRTPLVMSSADSTNRNTTRPT